MIEFLKNCVIEVCIGFDENENPIFEEETIISGEVFDVDIIDDTDDDVTQIQFGNGDVCFLDNTFFKKV